MVSFFRHWLLLSTDPKYPCENTRDKLNVFAGAGDGKCLFRPDLLEESRIYHLVSRPPCQSTLKLLGTQEIVGFGHIKANVPNCCLWKPRPSFAAEFARQWRHFPETIELVFVWDRMNQPVEVLWGEEQVSSWSVQCFPCSAVCANWVMPIDYTKSSASRDSTAIPVLPHRMSP